MACKKIVKNHSVCTTKIGKKYRVTHTRGGRHGGVFIHESKGELTKAQMKRYAKKLANEIRREVGRIKPRMTPYP